MKFGHLFKAGTGAETIREIIADMDLEALITQLKDDAKKSTNQRDEVVHLRKDRGADSTDEMKEQQYPNR